MQLGHCNWAEKVQRICIKIIETRKVSDHFCAATQQAQNFSSSQVNSLLFRQGSPVSHRLVSKGGPA